MLGNILVDTKIQVFGLHIWSNTDGSILCAVVHYVWSLACGPLQILFYFLGGYNILKVIFGPLMSTTTNFMMIKMIVAFSLPWSDLRYFLMASIILAMLALLSLAACLWLCFHPLDISDLYACRLSLLALSYFPNLWCITTWDKIRRWLPLDHTVQWLKSVTLC